MKALYFITLILCAILLVAVPLSAFAQEDGNNRFDSEAEAIEKAKKDFTEVLRQGYDFNFGVKADELAKSNPGPSIPYQNLDFDRLQRVDQDMSFERLVKEELKTVVPMILDGRIVTTFEIQQDKQSWKVSGLGDAAMAQNLNRIRRAYPGNQISLFWVPNLNVMVYSVSGTRKGTGYFAQYGDHTLDEPVEPSILLERLSEHARRFQAEYGDQIKEQRLVD